MAGQNNFIHSQTSQRAYRSMRGFWRFYADLSIPLFEETTPNPEIITLNNGFLETLTVRDLKV